MSNFALDVNSPQGDIISSLNYVLANLNTNAITSNVIIDIVGNVLANANVVTTNSTSGQLSSVNQGTISYLYNYVNVKYANNNTGSIGFSSNCTGKSYYGIHNTNNGTISTNPADYNWSQVAGGFGTTKGLYYTPSGGGTVYFAIATTPPSSRYLPVIDNTPIYLQNLANSIVQTYNITPGAVTNVSIAANTITGNNVQPNTLTALQIADRTLSSAQIALQGITGNVIAQNTITGNLVALNTITGNLVVPGTITGNLIQANTITGNLVAANTIQGSSIVAGSITATQIAAGTLTVANSIQSTDAVFGSYTSPGFWLDANTGTARFGSTISVGNNLAVGNNAVIGDTLVVGNNTVIGDTLAVGNNAVIGSNLAVGNNAVIGNKLTVGSNAAIGGNLTVGNNAVIGNNLAVGNNTVIGDTLVVGNNTIIGNNLAIGNNAQIGGNLTVAGLITSANLNSNTVQTTTLVQNATSTIGANTVYSTYTINSPVSGTTYPMGANVNISNVQPGWSFIASAFSTPTLTFTPSAPTGGVTFRLVIKAQDPNGTIIASPTLTTSVITWVANAVNISFVVMTFPSAYLNTITGNITGTYKFWLEQSATWSTGTTTTFEDGGRGLTISVFKR